jgi:hypothetical protein
MVNENTSYVRVKNYLTEYESNYLEHINVDTALAMAKVIKHYIKIQNGKKIIDNGKKTNKDNNEDLKQFLIASLTKTGNYQDTIRLMDIYAVYLDYCELHGMKVKTKQGLRKELENNGYVYTKAGGNRMVFRFVRLKTNEDKEWEL